MGQTNFDVNEVNHILAQAAEDAREMDPFLDSFFPEDALVTEWVADIADMHTKFGVNEVVRKLEPVKMLKFLEFRLNFLQEELDEAKSAYKTLVNLQDSEIMDEARREQIAQAADDIVDACIDLCVVSIGTLDTFDVDADLAWARVHSKNMEKEPGIKPERPNPLGLPDLIKPAGWTPPTHLDNIGLMSKF